MSDPNELRDPLDPQDPRLSAYALGELSDEDRAAVEAQLEQDGDAAHLITELRQVGSALENALRREPSGTLTDAQRAAIHGAARAVPRLARWTRVAAALLLCGLGGALAYHLWSDARREREIEERREAAARLDTPELRAAREKRVAEFLERERTVQELGYLGEPHAKTLTATLSEQGYIDSYSHGALLVQALGAAPGASHVRILRENPGETYQAFADHSFLLTTADDSSTFSIDVDTASYANARRFLLREGRLPPADSVRLEEFVNYFRYDDPPPTGEHPFAVRTQVASCPWQPRHLLVRIGLTGREIAWSRRPACNLVFLVDVSGSMAPPDKLPLLVRSLKLLVEQLDGRDSIAIVVYAGGSGLVLPPTPGNLQSEILAALDRLQAGGSTHGSAGIHLAYAVAREAWRDGGINRVILATDGDFNVGVTSREDLVAILERERQSGVFLSVLGFGTGNLQDATIEQLADHGNGNYAYVDSLAEARRVLIDEIGGTLLPIAKDVKIQVRFNPNEVAAWRLLGYENRQLADRDFDDDTKDAGEIGAGVHCTALYEVTPAGQPLPAGVMATNQGGNSERSDPVAFAPSELLLLRVRYKAPDGEQSRLIEHALRASRSDWQGASQDFRFAAAVAAFAQWLRGAPHLGGFTLDDIYNLAFQARGQDRGGYRREFLELVAAARRVSQDRR